MSRIVFGITGNLGTGKSTLALSLKSYWAKKGKELQMIEIDDVRRHALWKSTQPHHVQLRKDLAQVLDLSTDGEFSWINRFVFTELIFSNQENLNKYSQIATPFLLYDVEQKIKEDETDIAIVWSRLLEENFVQLLTSSVVITECSAKTVLERLSPSIENGGDLSLEELQSRFGLEGDTSSRLLIAKNKGIDFLIYDNEKIMNNNNLDELFEKLHQGNKRMLSEETDLNAYDQILNFCKFKIPLNGGRVIWEVTNECNYGCKYCIFASTGRKPEGELNTEEMFSALEQLKKRGFTHIKFTGGEPFLRDDMIDILKRTNELGFQFDISTNASKLTEKIVDELAKLNFEFIHVSLDGYDLQSHESVRGKKSFLPTLNGLRLLCAKGIKVRVGCVIHADNENYLPEVVRFCSSIGVRHVVFSMMEPVGRLRDKTTGLASKPINELVQSINDVQKNYPYLIISHNLQSVQKVFVESIKSFKKIPSTPCPAGERFLFINSLGVVSPCTWVSEHCPQYIGGRINKEPLDVILESAPIRQLREITYVFANNGEKLCPMVDIPSTSSIEVAIKASDIENHKEKFGSFAPIYRFTTENIKYLSMLEVENKKILTIGGSYDHSIDLALLGAKSVENIDINVCSRYYAQLKKAAILHLSYDEFKDFLGNSFSYDTYCKIRTYFPLDCVAFFNNLYERFGGDGEKLLHSPYFHNRENQNYLCHSEYLASESNYLKAREKLQTQNFIWHEQSIISTQNVGKFDIILLSNIADYSHKMFKGKDHAEQFKDSVVVPWLSNLNSNGRIVFAYVFDSQNILGSNKRNHFNDKEVRRKIYGGLEQYDLSEITLKSSIENALTDNVCILERKE